jgi:hypothetical protein
MGAGVVARRHQERLRRLVPDRGRLQDLVDPPLPGERLGPLAQRGPDAVAATGGTRPGPDVMAEQQDVSRETTVRADGHACVAREIDGGVGPLGLERLAVVVGLAELLDVALADELDDRIGVGGSRGAQHRGRSSPRRHTRRKPVTNAGTPSRPKPGARTRAHG